VAYILVLVNLQTKEFEILGRCDDSTEFIKEVGDLYRKTAKKITGYTPDANKSSQSCIIKDWEERGFKLSKGIYLKLKEAANLK
jgi:hypothetical protein